MVGHNQTYLDTNRSHLLSLTVHQMESLIRTKLDLSATLGVVVQPFLHIHLVHGLPVVVLLPLGLNSATTRAHYLQ